MTGNTITASPRSFIDTCTPSALELGSDTSTIEPSTPLRDSDRDWTRIVKVADRTRPRRRSHPRPVHGHLRTEAAERGIEISCNRPSAPFAERTRAHTREVKATGSDVSHTTHGVAIAVSRPSCTA